MRIFVKTITLTPRDREWTSVLELKQHIQDTEDIPPDHQKLYWKIPLYI